MPTDDTNDPQWPREFKTTLENMRTQLIRLTRENERLHDALQELDAEPRITVAEHVGENRSLARYLPKSAAICAPPPPKPIP